MAENKKSFVMYADWLHTIRELTDDEAGKILKHLLSYVNDENPILEDRILKLVFEPIKLQLKRDLVKYEIIREKRSEAGKQGGLASGHSRSKDKQNEANEANALETKQNEANEAVNDNVTVTVNDTDIKDSMSKDKSYDEPSPENKYFIIPKDGKSVSEFITQFKPTFPDPYKTLWNIFAEKYSFAKVSKITSKRLTSLKNRLKENEFDFIEILKMSGKSKGLTGASWFSFDFLISNDTNYIKVLEGKYLKSFIDDKKPFVKEIKYGAQSKQLTPEQLKAMSNG